MNKARIDQLLSNAYAVLISTEIAKKKGISENYTVPKTFRGQISSFGAAVSMGSLLSSVAFFSQKGGSDIDRDKLMLAIYKLIEPNDKNGNKASLFNYIKNQNNQALVKEEIINACIALKLAMNLFSLSKDKDDNVEEGES